MFMIEDELHATQWGPYVTLAEAIAELRRRVLIPWDQEPNRAPCSSWQTCGRNYEIVECDDAWNELRHIPALKISAEKVVWADGMDHF